MTRAGAEQGFTLVEVLVTMAITVVVFGATLAVLDVFQKDNRFAQLRNETQDNARSAMDRLARELRSVAAPSTKVAGALERAESYAVTFETVDSSKTVAPGSNLSNAMRVRYCLDDSSPTNEILWRQVKRWESEAAPALSNSTACPDATVGAWDSSARLVDHVTNRIGGQSRVAFTYGPASATEVSQIVSVEPTLYLDLNPGARPGETQLTSSITLRNENRPPSASFSAVQLGAPRVVSLNASESADPDGLALTYKWWDNGSLLNTTAQQYETSSSSPFAVGSTQVFKLEVTDPGGLSTSSERTVVIQ
jgi:prepilin-type N-terminal cleavage/methylation domain-containing protein